LLATVIENSHNQSQQVKVVPAQKSSKGTVKCKRQFGHFRVKTGRVQFLQMPVSSHYFVQLASWLITANSCVAIDRYLQSMVIVLVAVKFKT